MPLPHMPMNITRIDEEEAFCFDCNASLPCFTHCCRQLELALTPYDVLRLKNAIGMHSRIFLDRFVIIERNAEDPFPRFYLTMVNDGQASCAFLQPSGCTVYEHRPGACRTYPLGRAAVRHADNHIEEAFVVLKEDHCRGFEQNIPHTPQEYTEDQKIKDYNKNNDALIGLLQHDKIRTGMKLNAKQARLYALVLYDIDSFREEILHGTIATWNEPPDMETVDDDLALLHYGVRLLTKTFYI